MVYHVTDYVAATSHLTYELSTELEDLERCQEMLSRLRMLDPNSPVPDEVKDFIEYYTGTESLGEVVGDTMSVLGKILTALKNAIVRLCEILYDIFKMIFDTEYRVRRQFADIQRSLLSASADPEAVKRFQDTPASVISQEDCDSAIAVNNILINLMKMVGSANSGFEIDNLLDDVFQSKAKIKVVKGVIRDDFGDLSAKHWPTLADAGWTIQNFDTTISRHVDCLTNFEQLKDTESRLKKESNSLKHEITSMLNKNLSMTSIQPLQIRVALISRMTKSIGEVANILVTRTGAITTILRALHAQLVRVNNELKEERARTV